jgi:alkylation response protein AidB-like acyl-CoA dehydrogenase
LRLAALPPGVEAFRAEVKAFLAANLPSAPADLRARSWIGFSVDFSRKLSARNWVGVTHPTEYGAANLGYFNRNTIDPAVGLRFRF